MRWNRIGAMQPTAQFVLCGLLLAQVNGLGRGGVVVVGGGPLNDAGCGTGVLVLLAKRVADDRHCCGSVLASNAMR